MSLFALYLTLGALLVLVHHALPGDAWSRVGNAYYVLFSRDPHLAAMGFVWNPMPSLLTLPFLPLMAAWPPLVRDGFIMVLWSAVFMAFAAQQLFGTLRDARVATPLALLAALGFALHPVIVQYGANGMTEALFILALVVIVRYLARWVRTNETAPLVIAGIALGVAYLVRYEAAPVGIAAGALVLAIAFRRAEGERRDRILRAVADALVFGLPLATMFLAWMLASWVVVGQPFEQFSSSYGTTSQLAAEAEGIDDVGMQATTQSLMFAIRQIGSMTPLLLPILAVAAVVGALRRDRTLLVPLAVFGGVLAFALVAWMTGRTAGWLRYYITVVPFAALLAGWTLGALWERVPRVVISWRDRIRESASRSVVLVVTAVVLVMQLVSVPAGAVTLGDQSLARPEGTVSDVLRWESGRQVAAYLDGLDAGEGEILLDAFLGFPIILHTADPRQFVITPDRDFPAVLADPATFGVRYIVVPPPGVGLGDLDAITREYPGFYADGGGIATLIHEFDAPSPNLLWRVFQVNEPRVNTP